MIKVEELFIAPTATVLETLRKLDETGQRILFIAPEGHLKAVIKMPSTSYCRISAIWVS